MDFIAFKIPSSSAGLESTNLGYNDKHDNQYTTENNCCLHKICYLFFVKYLGCNLKNFLVLWCREGGIIPVAKELIQFKSNSYSEIKRHLFQLQDHFSGLYYSIWHLYCDPSVLKLSFPHSAARHTQQRIKV
jgi:hypothetical protein